MFIVATPFRRCLSLRKYQLFLVALIFSQIHCILGQDIVALSSYQEGVINTIWEDVGQPPILASSTQQLTFDVTNLGPGRDFYNRDHVHLQLGDDRQIKSFARVLGNSSTNHHFVGENDSGDSLQMIRYISPTTGRQLLIGSLVDLDSKLVYQFRQTSYSEEDSFLKEEQVLITASVTPSKDIPDSLEPMQLDSATQAKMDKQHKKDDQAFFADPMNHISSATPDALNTILRPLPEDDDVNIVTLMMVWSRRSECEYSNLTWDCEVTQETEDRMRALIAASVAETNAAYTLSNVPIQHELVHAYRHETFKETEIVEGDFLNTGALFSTLVAMTRPWDGQLDDVRRNRRQYQADMVSMVITDPEYCGVANIGSGFWPVPSAPFMYSAVAYDCLSGTYVLAHELGHNFGCSHDRGTNSQCDFWWFYHANGWRDPQSQFRTIMAYQCRAGQCDDNPGTPCPTIPRFSDRDATYSNGSPLGNRRNNCAKHLRRYGRRVSRFYGKGCLGLR